MRLNKSQKYAIQWMVSQGHDVTQIVKELKIHVDAVNKFIEKNCKPNDDNTVKTTSSRVKASDLMIHKTAEKGTKNVAVMTKEASEVADNFKKNVPTQSHRHSDAIHRIHE